MTRVCRCDLHQPPPVLYCRAVRVTFQQGCLQRYVARFSRWTTCTSNYRLLNTPMRSCKCLLSLDILDGQGVDTVPLVGGCLESFAFKHLQCTIVILQKSSPLTVPTTGRTCTDNCWNALPGCTVESAHVPGVLHSSCKGFQPFAFPW